MALDPVEFSEVAKAYADAWSSKSPEAVASFYAPDGSISINRGETLKGHAAIAEMAAGFFADIPDLVLHCDDVRLAGNHALFLWTFEGHYARTKNAVRISGWEERELDENYKVTSALGWFDAADYQRQIG
jgi:uncharacterized protein (TIGR02246 family)